MSGTRPTHEGDSELAMLRRQLESFAELLDAAQDGVLVATIDGGRFRYVNRRICELLGYTPVELLGLSVDDIHPPEALPEVRRVFAAQAAGQLRTGGALPIRRKDGSVLHADVSSGRVEFEGTPCLLGIFHDVTDRLNAQREAAALNQELRSTSTLLEAILDAIPDVIGVQDHAHRVLRYNRAGYQYLGVTAADLNGKHCYELIGHDRPCAECATSVAYRTRAPAQLRKYVPELDVWLDARSYPILDEQGKIVRVVEHLRDITAEVRALEALRDSEARLRQAHKLEAIGTLAGGVAHDFNNLLAAILGSVELARLGGPLPDPTRSALDTIGQAARRASELTAQLLGFARKGKLSDQPVDLHLVITETAAMLRRTIDRRIVVRHELNAAAAVVLGDKTQLQQVLLNLGINARDAMPHGGELVFATRHAAPPPALAAVTDAPVLLLEVRDTGVGMEPSVAEHAFEPFFTTKAEGDGTGLGLSMVYGIVQNHHGEIAVESRPGAGTTFRLWLPLHDRAVVAEPLVARALPRRRGTVLLVEDEQMVRVVVAEMLRGLGFEVLTAGDGQAGADLFAAHRDTIDLAIVDLIMPRVGGVECCRRIRALNQAARLLIASGYAEDGAVRQLLDEGIAGFVQKPFDLMTLSRAIAQVWPAEPAPQGAAGASSSSA